METTIIYKTTELFIDIFHFLLKKQEREGQSHHILSYSKPL